MKVVAAPPRSKYDSGRPNTPVADRFWPKVKKSPDPDGCWEWTGSRLKDRKGRLTYGRIQVGSRRDGSHRPAHAHHIAWELENGPVPLDMQVLHRCDNPGCVRADHLFLGTNDDNMADKARKGRVVVRRALTDAQAIEVSMRYRRGNGVALAKEFGVTHPTIYAAVAKYGSYSH